MTSMDHLKDLSDEELLGQLARLLNQSRRVEAVLVAHIGEVDDRRAYIGEAPSMFAYCTQIPHLSEAEAYARITVARAARRFPDLLVMLEEGRLHLTGIAKLAPHLTEQNRRELIDRAMHKTKAQIEELIAEIAPRPDAPATMRKLPGRTGSQLGPDRVGGLTFAIAPSDQSVAVRSEPPARVPAVVAIAPLSPARYKVQFTASAELRDKLDRLQTLLHKDLEMAIEAAVTEKLARVESKRFGLTETPRKDLSNTDTSPCSRYLPAAVKRLVRLRDGNQCTFILGNGSRCTERRWLEFHHRDAYGRGGSHDPDNVCLMCRGHNAHLAEVDYGKEHIAKYRRDPDRVSEGASRYLTRSWPASTDEQPRAMQ